MLTDNIVVVGSSGHAKVVIDVVEKQGRHRIAGLVDTFKEAGQTVFGYKVLGVETDLPALAQSLEITGCIVAIGDNWRRHLVADRIAAVAPSLEFITAVHPSAQLARGVTVGRGTVIMAGAVVNSDCRIGPFCILNTGARLDHDSQMEEFSSLAPGVVTGGTVRIGAYSAVSLGANIIHGRTIGKHTVVGAGTLVLQDIPDYSVAYGSPARVARTRQEGDKYL